MRELEIINTKNETFLGRVYVADKTGTRIKGLLGIRELPFLWGLLIRPCRQGHTLGMRYPLSVWFINQQNEIIKIVDFLPAWRISPFIPNASFVLEFPANWAEITGSEEGDSLRLLQPSGSGG